MRPRHIIILIWLSVFAASCGNTGGEDTFKVSHELAAIDSLMWQQPDSALAVMQDFAGSPAADRLDTFEKHYCQLLMAELLFKNYYDQTNRTELLQAVAYFDSLMQVPELVPEPVEGREGPSDCIAFMDARAHYINGAAYFEHDSLIEACTEYLHTLRTMESHFTESELVGKKARFMALTYNRLLELFSPQFMQEPAIYCGKQSLAYDKIAQASPKSMARTLVQIGTLYEELKEYDSAAYYHEKALEVLSDRNSWVYRDVLVYRDVVSGIALLKYNLYHDTVASLDSLKSMVAQAADEGERTTRYLTIGSIYHDMRQPDSAKVYLERVFAFEKDAHRMKLAAKTLHDIALNEGDTLKTGQYAQFLVEDAASAPEKQMRVSQLNDLFQNYLQEKQKAASLRERRKLVRTILAVVAPLVVIMAIVVVILIRRRNKKRMAVQEAETQRQLNEATQRHDEAERKLQTRMEQAEQHTRKMLQQRAKAIYQSTSEDKLQRIMTEFETTYPHAISKLGKAYPDLSETERNILLLNFLHFRIKEEADLLGLSQNTVGKYRSNLGKTLGKDPIPDWV